MNVNTPRPILHPYNTSAVVESSLHTFCCFQTVLLPCLASSQSHSVVINCVGKAKQSCAVMKLTLSTKQPKPPLLPNITMNMPLVILKQLTTILYSAVDVIPPPNST
mmetsp:Transcript_25230/g.37208  ORF Transcript_25230/g.37208 Transcript_25230/m.37208 type:complete len:107 (-) Transcript_25230:497-817(-)|eukprot:scaffold7672_cov175-Skeletonema_dohrnii-CCMP3373.AAC.2